MSKPTETLTQICKISEITGLSSIDSLEVVNAIEGREELEVLLNLKDIDINSESITYEQLNTCSFNRAHEIIQKMTIKKRIKMLDELDRRLLYLYESVDKYNDQMFGKSMSPKDFMTIMGKIKHTEIIQTWLYGID